MKHIRIGAGSGGCTFERMEPTIELLEHGGLDYLVFECLAERTIADAQADKLKDPAKGYNPMLEERMRAVLPLAAQKGVKIISNMGGANTAAAVRRIEKIASELGLSPRIAMVSGDDLTSVIDRYLGTKLCDSSGVLGDLNGVISANAYLSGDPIAKALDEGAEIVITGRVADPALFVGPLKHEFGWNEAQPDKLGQALLLGHLMECASQLTGGYYADPGFKDVPDMHRLGQPIADIDESGKFIITKPAGSGGLISTDVCREQLLYEIGDPSCYITPDGIADFSQVRFTQLDAERVLAEGGMCAGVPDTYKVNIGYSDCFVGFGEISYGGSGALARARLAADTIQKRWELRGIAPLESRFDCIGFSSLYGEEISGRITPEKAHEIRLRVSVRTRTREEAAALLREVQVLYINGPAGGGGICTDIDSQMSVDNIIIPRRDAPWSVSFIDAGQFVPVSSRYPMTSSPRRTCAGAAHSSAVPRTSAYAGEHRTSRPGSSGIKLRDIAHVRTGDKGNCCNICVIPYRDEDYPMLKERLTAGVVADFYEPICKGSVTRYEVDSVCGLNFVLEDSLAGGVTRSLAVDKHGKTLGMALLEIEI